MSQPTPAQMQALLQYASKALGVSEEQLLSAVRSNNGEALAASLPDSARESLNAMLGDPSKTEALLRSPQVRELLKRFS